MQKAFTVILLALTLYACSPNAAMQGNGQSYLQGQWMQDSVAGQKQLLSYSLYEFRFSCDSVYATIKSISKVNTGYDTCMNAGHWTEYVRGTYEQKNDTLRIKGSFCNADFSLKSAGGCFRSGVYQDVFKVSRPNDSLIQFASASNVIPIKLRLINKVSCNLKPL